MDRTEQLYEQLDAMVCGIGNSVGAMILEAFYKRLQPGATALRAIETTYDASAYDTQECGCVRIRDRDEYHIGKFRGELSHALQSQRIIAAELQRGKLLAITLLRATSWNYLGDTSVPELRDAPTVCWCPKHRPVAGCRDCRFNDERCMQCERTFVRARIRRDALSVLAFKALLGSTVLGHQHDWALRRVAACIMPLVYWSHGWCIQNGDIDKFIMQSRLSRASPSRPRSPWENLE